MTWLIYKVIGTELGCKPMLYEPPHDKTNKMICASSEDTDQTGRISLYSRTQIAVSAQKKRLEVTSSAIIVLIAFLDSPNRPKKV